MTVLVLGAGEAAIRGLGLAPAFEDSHGDYVPDSYVPFKPRPGFSDRRRVTGVFARSAS